MGSRRQQQQQQVLVMYWKREAQGRIMPGAAAPGKLPGKLHDNETTIRN